MCNNINYVIGNSLCTGCGLCEDVCPRHCITIERKKGEYRPSLDSSKCIGDKCGRCLKICPGVGVKLEDIAQQSFVDSSIKVDKYIGRYIGLHTGYSKDEDIRYHSASGGMVSQFLIYLLEKRFIDGAVVTGYSEDKVTPYSYIASTRDDIIKARSSKYCPVALNKVGNEIVQSVGNRYVIVGLPCHIQGFRKRAIIDRKFREKIIGYFSIYCSSSRTFNAQDFLFQHYKVEKQDIKYFAYRDNGCLGNLSIIAKNEVSVPYIQYYGPLLRSFFKPHRCLTCVDHYGEIADVCFGDIHIKPYSEDRIGVSSWITRTKYWENLFWNAAEEGYFYMTDVDPQVLNESQSIMLYSKSRKAGAVVSIDRILGRRSPVFDKLYEKPRLKDYISVLVCYAQRFVGRHRLLWFIIELLYKEK